MKGYLKNYLKKIVLIFSWGLIVGIASLFFFQPELAYAGFNMEVQKFTDIDTSWDTKSFLNTYTTPVVIVTAEPNSSWAANDPPFGVNIKSVTTTGCDIRITIPDCDGNCTPGNMPSNNIVYMLVVESGYWDSSNSKLTFKLEAQRFDSTDNPCDNTYGTTVVSNGTVSRDLNAGWSTTAHHYFANASIDNEDAWIDTAMFASTTRTAPPTTTQTTGILVGLSSAECTPQDNHLAEEIHFVVIEAGTHSFDGQSFRAFRTNDSVGDYGDNNLEAHGFGEAPVWGIADLVAMDGSDGAWVNWKITPFDATNVDPYCQEDKYQNTEVNHTNEHNDVFIADTTSWSVTYVDLVSFEATSIDEGIRVSWQTGCEIDNVGFNLYRAQEEDGEYQKINPKIIPAAGDTTLGNTYNFIDDKLTPGLTYYYKLEDIDRSGKKTQHGPISVEWQR